MKKLYRIDYRGTPRHVIEDRGAWRLLDGDPFDRHSPGEEIERDGHRLLALRLLDLNRHTALCRW